ncbi:MAG TPA: glycoside hydrolase family 3 N-terminal domain-containing protein, partial [Chroococcidiopsis sp.]
LQGWASIPLLLCADIEEGVGQRFAGATWFPPPLALGAIARHDMSRAVAYAEQMGAAIAQEALAIGLNWLLAPVADVNNNPANPVINVRACGETATAVSQLTTAFIRGAHRHRVLTTAKHFPGHGDTAIDSHLELPVIPHERERLATTEFPPFAAAIAAGVDAVMTAHLQIPALDANYPATLSHPILTGELRQRLGFEGLIVTDALIMGAIAQRYGPNEAPVLALEAGADIVLMPADPAGAIQAICAAVETGRLEVDRIHASLERIWQAKRQVCSVPLAGDTSHAWETVQPPPVQLEHLAQPDAIATAEQILSASMQVHSPVLSRLNTIAPTPTAQTGPSGKSPMPLRNLIILDDALNCDLLGRQAAAIALPTRLGYQLHVIDRHTPAAALDPSLSEPCPTLLQLFIRGNPFRGSAGQTQAAERWLHALLDTDHLLALVLYGSPYTLEQFVPKLPPDVPYVFTYGQTPQAQAIALQALFANTHHQEGIGDRTFTT